MSRLRRWWIWLLAGLLAGGVLAAVLWNPFRQVVQRLSLPLVRLSARATQAAVKRVWSRKMPDNKLRPEYVTELERRVSSLAVEYARLHALEEENRTLRAQAKFLFASGYDSVGARVIARDIHFDRAVITIDRGREDSIEVGQAVVVEEGILIGKVSNLKERIATVELLTDPRSRLTAAVSGEGWLIGVVEGRGNGSAVLTYIPSSEKLKKDQVIVTSGTEEKIPAHLPLAMINAVEGKTTDPFLRAIVEPLLPLDSMMFVSVLRPSALRPRL